MGRVSTVIKALWFFFLSLHLYSATCGYEKRRGPRGWDCKSGWGSKERSGALDGFVVVWGLEAL
jgi:hypothetical protein